MSVLLQFAAKLLIAIFLVGIAGSLVVILVTFIEDLEIFFQDQESKDQIG